MTSSPPAGPTSARKPPWHRETSSRASALAHNALAEFASHAERQGIADGLETLAAVAAARSDPGRAATLAGAAAAIRETNRCQPVA